MLKNLASGFALAFSMLSILPFFKVHTFFRGINGYGVFFYPFVGFVLGLILYGVWIVLAGVIPSFHLGIVLFFLWVLVTGALHLDGFADTIDGLFVPKERSLEVMKDPHNGGMGMLFSGAFLILKASSVAHLGAYWILPFVLMFARYGAVVQIYFFEYISGGIAKLAKEEFSRRLFFAVSLFVVSVAFASHTLPLLGVSFVFALLVGWSFLRRYGGMSGDMYGFTIELTEVLLLNLVLAGMV